MQALHETRSLPRRLPPLSADVQAEPGHGDDEAADEEGGDGVHGSVLHGWVIGVVVGDELDDVVTDAAQDVQADGLKKSAQQGKRNGDEVAHVSPLLRARRGLGVSQNRPVDIGPQVFAADGARRGAFDGRTVLGGDLTISELPLVYGSARYPKRNGKPCLGTNYCRRAVNRMN